ncbi:hypothetical protein ABQZ99_017820 [Xanthomonas hortorum pv. vitians]|uniref:Uncharacterized protein n=1 Tax=Xanthomonas hortorum pv. vitians TaxID=83224 RepID=A0A6V7CIR3_9XANT|nr:hypothetical protein [Xanthomonas hortorum]APP86554.1 hypothetical protein BI317_22935 [Xanthomonas hortorum pv. gardneri]ASW46752.1 hypothetical protein XJ27_12840 [Xanthomonas hortorum]MCC8495015.1 hypothetical protein [Xanthomonas hortorum pv. gardneri]MCE4299672.1 hypothetical protein [Xanthomonas hortorum pv. vitians]MCE4302640.1 hypothetical protein [Xanthomonas hortorum pv. vitians]
MNNSRRQSMTVSNQPGKPRLSEQRLAADLEAFQQSGGAIERLGDTPLRRDKKRGESDAAPAAAVAANPAVQTTDASEEATETTETTETTDVK